MKKYYKFQVKKSGTDSDLKIIVSRSHSGKVESVAKETFGSEVKVTPAGGAGFKVLEVVSGRQVKHIFLCHHSHWDCFFK
jgi:inositol monophosphatase 3